MTQTFACVAVFQYSAEAQIIKGRLEAEGIETFLADNHTIDTDPLVSNAIGGVKLKVRKKDEDRALKILESISKFTVDEEGDEIQCPKCHSGKIELLSNVRSPKSFFFFCLSLLFVVLPVYIKRNYQCTTCNHQFK